MVWSIPEHDPKENITTPAICFDKHSRKVGHVLFHPTAENVLLSSGADLLIKLFDIQKGQEMLEITGHTDIVNSLAWNWNGSLLATTSKDKKLRIFDVRSNKIVQVRFYCKCCNHIHNIYRKQQTSIRVLREHVLHGVVTVIV